MAAKAGATYVSPFVGRLDDISHFGMELIRDIQIIFENYAFETEVIVASIRNPIHVLEAARIGADIATIPYSVIKQLIKHPLTDIGIEKFLSDWEKNKKNERRKGKMIKNKKNSCSCRTFSPDRYNHWTCNCLKV